MASTSVHVVLAAATALAWLGLGSVLLAPAGTSGDGALDALNRIGAGAAAFALLTFAAGWCSALYTAAYVPVFVAAAAAGAAAARRSAPQRLRPAPRLAAWEWALALVVAVYVLAAVVCTAAPISEGDALLYHATDPSLFAHAHRIFEIHWNWSSYQPYTVEMLVLDGMLLHGSIQGAFAPLLLSLAALGAVTAFAWRVGGRRLALLAAAVFFAEPFVLWESASTYVEPGLTLFATLSGWNGWLFAKTRSTWALVLCGVFAGAAAGTKYSGLFVVVAVAAAVGLVAAPFVRPRHAAIYGAAAIGVALPWYAKNTILTGNPVYPLLFGGVDPAVLHAVKGDVAAYGQGTSPLDALLLPFRLLGDPHGFGGADWLSPLLLMFAPVAFLGRSRNRFVWAAWAGVAIYAACWFATSQQTRFLMPALPALAVLAGLGILTLAGRGRVGLWVTVAATVAALTTGAAVSGRYVIQFVPVAAGFQSHRAFLRRYVADYAAAEWLNSHARPRAKVLTDIYPLLYLRVPYVVFGTHGEGLPWSAGPAATRAYVERVGATEIAVGGLERTRLRQARALGLKRVAAIPTLLVTTRVPNIRGFDVVEVYRVGGRAAAGDRAAPPAARPALSGTR